MTDSVVLWTLTGGGVGFLLGRLLLAIRGAVEIRADERTTRRIEAYRREHGMGPLDSDFDTDFPDIQRLRKLRDHQ